MPKIIMHNQISLDGAVSGFQIDPGTYYSIVNNFNAEMYLVGSGTAISGIKLFAKSNPYEKPEDFTPPLHKSESNSPIWVFPDSSGKLEGLLHIYRRYQHCRDVIVLVTMETPETYINYLEERKYNYFVCGEVKVNYKTAFTKILEKFPFKTMLTDNGGKLSSILLENGLIDQISLIVSPTLTGKKPPKLFIELKLGKRVIKLNPLKAEIMESRDILLLYDIVK